MLASSGSRHLSPYVDIQQSPLAPLDHRRADEYLAVGRENYALY